MKSKKELIRVFVKGGILSPADLLNIMGISKALGNDHVAFGARQDVIFPMNGHSKEEVTDAFKSIDIEYETGSANSVYQNIVSSYAAVNVVETRNWVKEGVYQIVMADFRYRPKLKINIVDSVQSFAPLFSGELNFIASETENYWFLYLRKQPNNNRPEQWPRLVFSNDIAKLAECIEDILENRPLISVEDLYDTVQTILKLRYKKIDKELSTPEQNLPYYEGINSLLNNRYWLGLYWRTNRYNLDFMTAACKLCQETNIGKVSILPWKSFVIKSIKSDDRIRWEKLLGKFGMNMRHSSLELNWHLPVYDDEALELKQFLVAELNQRDISTFGLTFSIKTNRPYYWFTTVVIEKIESELPLEESYNILYAQDFNPNNSTYFTYATKVRKEIIPSLLIELSKIYFRQLNLDKDTQSNENIKGITKEVSVSYQCCNCLSLYENSVGDPSVDIPPGTPFSDLPDDYKCHVCDTAKAFFEPVHGH